MLPGSFLGGYMKIKSRFPDLSWWEKLAPHAYARIEDFIPGCLGSDKVLRIDEEEIMERLRIFEDAAGFTEDALCYLPEKKADLERYISEHPVFGVFDKTLSGYLQVLPDWTAQDRIKWLANVIRHTIAYVRFREARNQFKAYVSKEEHLTAIVSRLFGQAIEVEAGAYACRDLANVLKLIRQAVA